MLSIFLQRRSRALLIFGAILATGVLLGTLIAAASFVWLPATRWRADLLRLKVVEGCHKIGAREVLTSMLPGKLRAGRPPASHHWNSWSRRIPFPSGPAKEEYTFFSLFKGPTHDIPDLGVHASVLRTGVSPHSFHSHPQEELIVILSGEATILRSTARGTDRRQVRGGHIVYHPPNTPHTIRGGGEGDARYVVFRWEGPPRARDEVLQPSILDARAAIDRLAQDPIQPFRAERLFYSPTPYLRGLECHVSTVEPGAGYVAHRDRYDVVIVVLRGTIETVGRTLSSRDVIFYSAHEPHGLRNASRTPASYIVFEFHS